MGPERRGRAVQGRLEVNPSGEEPTDGPKQKLKSFEIRKRLVFEAWEKVRANSGAPGVDAVSIDDFGPARLCGIEGCWHRLGSLCHEDAAGFEVDGVGEAVGAAAQHLEQVVDALDSAVGGPVAVVPGEDLV